MGLGNMGTPMAERLVDWPGGLIVYDVRPEAMQPLVDAGARGARDVAEVAAACVISVTVLNDEQVREVVAELAAHVQPGTAIAIHSTISDRTAAELAAQLAPKHIHVIDAPISGGASAARKNDLAVMVGATPEAFEVVREPFARWAGLVVYAGEPGAGTRMKLARNMLTFTSYAAACEAQRLAHECGLDVAALGKVVRHTDAITGGPGAILVRDSVGPLEPEDFFYQPFSHTRDLGEKDLQLALDLGAERGVDLPLAEIALQTLATGLGVADPEPADKGARRG
ncbi:MAG TPA: NAD(P)-dependent oxidoreductase [Mycobacterium sp.]|nr:NAD(P)-dependent oxidoreductase [Mycobacterium sp.]